MDNVLTWLKWLAALVGATITAVLGGWDKMLQVLVFVVVLDYATGVTAAFMEKKLDSQVGFRGIAKKVLLFVPVAMGYSLDQILGQNILRSLAIWFYLANEGLSVLENLARAGVPVSPPLKAALEQLRQKGEGKEVPADGNQ